MAPSLWDHTTERIQSGLQRIAGTEDGRIYAVSILLSSAVDIDPRWSTLELSRETEERYEARSGASPDAPDTRWNTEYYLTAPGLVWDPDDDPEGHAALEQWARDRELWFEGPPLSDANNQIERELALHDEIVTGLIATIRGLHDSGAVTAVFGCAVPTILMSQDDHDPYPEWNQEANPPELYAQFGPYLESIWSPG